MKITVITPFYKGNKYMSQYFACMATNIKNMDGDEVEIILVNDSPEEEIDLSAAKEQSLALKVVTLPYNSGIHSARVQGLSEATGDYIMFLDQDDRLSEDALCHFAKKAIETGKDVIVSNALLEQPQGSELWYRTDYHKNVVWDKNTYLIVGNQIMSPGQCIIKRDAVPKQWTENILKTNCCDDYYLWLLMISGLDYEYIDKPLYIHSYTGNNVSADPVVTYESTMEMIHYLRRDTVLSEKDINLLYRMVKYKFDFKQVGKIKKILMSLCNIKIAVTNIKYKKKTKTPYGFNRW